MDFLTTAASALPPLEALEDLDGLPPTNKKARTTSTAMAVAAMTTSPMATMPAMPTMSMPTMAAAVLVDGGSVDAPLALYDLATAADPLGAGGSLSPSSSTSSSTSSAAYYSFFPQSSSAHQLPAHFPPTLTTSTTGEQFGPPFTSSSSSSPPKSLSYMGGSGEQQHQPQAPLKPQKQGGRGKKRKSS